jgi:hypothetical protein
MAKNQKNGAGRKGPVSNRYQEHIGGGKYAKYQTSDNDLKGVKEGRWKGVTSR